MKRLSIWLLLLVLLLATSGRVLAGPFDPPIAPIFLPLVIQAQPSLSGQITTALGELVPGITISTDHGQQTVTDAAGRYQLTNLAPGT